MSILIVGIWECKEGTTDIHYMNWADGIPLNGTGNYCAVIYPTSSWNAVHVFSHQSCSMQAACSPSLAVKP